MSVKEHYDNHLGNFYDWMVGDFQEKVNEHISYFEENNILPQKSKDALDLGSGHGIQSVALAEIGFNVKALDFNKQLLNKLKLRSKGLSIEIIEDDLLNFNHYANNSELIICMGDTISHMNSFEEIESLIIQANKNLASNGKLIFSFRDYSTELKGNDRYIPVKSDDNRILTCILDYKELKVNVTDQLYEKIDGSWVQKISSYYKLRVTQDVIVDLLNRNKFEIISIKEINRMFYIIAEK